MDFHSIFIRSPVNKTAMKVVSQRGAAESDKPLDRHELAHIVERLSRKQRLLKRVLNIGNKSQHRNAIYKSNKGFKNYRLDKEPRAFVEYKRIGLQIQHLNTELSAMRKLRKIAHECRVAA